jgi:hypothetical protein
LPFNVFAYPNIYEEVSMTQDEFVKKFTAAFKAAVQERLSKTQTLSKRDLDVLVTGFAHALNAVLTEMGTLAVTNEASEAEVAEDGNERVIWTGRPLLSLVTKYILTAERLEIETGFFGKETDQVDLVKVQDAGSSQSFMQRIFDLGDITLRTHDPNNTIVVLRNVPDFRYVVNTIKQAVARAKRAAGLQYREEM